MKAFIFFASLFLLNSAFANPNLKLIKLCNKLSVVGGDQICTAENKRAEIANANYERNQTEENLKELQDSSDARLECKANFIEVCADTFRGSIK